MKKSFLALAVSVLSVGAVAQTNGAVTGKISTLGVGLEYSFPVSEQFDIGINTNYFSINRDFNQDDLDIDAKARFLTLGVIGYYFPMDNGFNINSGLYYNGNKVTIDAQPNASIAGQTYTFNNQTYRADNIQNATGSINFNKIAPYVGIGWKSGDRSKEGFAFDANLGVMFHGKPNVNFSATCSGALAANQAACDRLKEDIAAERNDIQKDADDFKFYPVASIGFIYRF